MQTLTTSNKPDFKPITHTITIENENELNVLLKILKNRESISYDLATSGVGIEINEIENIIYDALEGLERHVYNR